MANKAIAMDITQRTLAEENMPLALWYIKKRGLPFQDYCDLLFLALCKGVVGYTKSNCKVKISTYLVKCFDYAVLKEQQKERDAERCVSHAMYQDELHGAVCFEHGYREMPSEQLKECVKGRLKNVPEKKVDVALLVLDGLSFLEIDRRLGLSRGASLRHYRSLLKFLQKGDEAYA